MREPSCLRCACASVMKQIVENCSSARGCEWLQDELLLDTGVAKLTDFGLSKTIASVLPPPPLFGSGARGGSAGDFPRFAEGSRGEDSGCGGPRLRFDGVSQRHTSPQLVAREVSAGSLQAQARPQLRPGVCLSLHPPMPRHFGLRFRTWLDFSICLGEWTVSLCVSHAPSSCLVYEHGGDYTAVQHGVE